MLDGICEKVERDRRKPHSQGNNVLIHSDIPIFTLSLAFCDRELFVNRIILFWGGSNF